MKQKIIAGYLLIYFFCFLYSSLHTVIGLDEVMLLDPVRNFIDGHYSSRLWYAEGTEDHFMAYLPLGSCGRWFFLYIFPDNLFFNRLPFILLFIGTTILVYKIVDLKFSNDFLTVLTTILFINDKGLWDAIFSGRTEIIQLFFIALYLYIDLKNKNIKNYCLMGLIIGCLFLTHLPAWIIALLLLVYLFNKDKIKLFCYSLICAGIPVLIYLFTINFDINGLFSQLFMGGNLLPEESGFLSRIAHLYQRFLPYPYLYQPWVLILLIAGFFAFKIKNDKYIFRIYILFITYLLFLVLASGNYSRYNPPLLLFCYLLFPALYNYYIEKTGFRITRSLQGLLILIITIPVGIRFIKICSNRESNSTNKVVEQARVLIPFTGIKTLVIGEPVGYYISKEIKNTDYTTTFSIRKFNQEAYNRIYFLSYENPDPNKFKMEGEIIHGPIKDGTYAGLKLFRLTKD